MALISGIYAVRGGRAITSSPARLHPPHDGLVDAEIAPIDGFWQYYQTLELGLRHNCEYYLPRKSRTIYDGAAGPEGEKPLRLKGLNVLGC